MQDGVDQLTDVPAFRCRQMCVDDAPAGSVERRKIAKRLGVLERAECERLSRNVEVGVRRRGDQKEDARRPASLVELAG